MVEISFIEEAIHRLLAAAPPGSKVILFGSYARGQADDRSDVDLLVVEPEVGDPFSEAVRMYKMLAGVPIAVDIIVLSAERFDYWKETPTTLAYQAVKDGRVYEKVA